MPNGFTQISFGNRTKAQPPLGSVTSISVESMTADRLKDFRLQLYSQLQMTLVLEQLLSSFHQQLKQVLPISGIQYLNSDKMVDTHTGHLAKHTCSYQLSMHKRDFGNIIFTRGKRFTEKEMEFIESVMDVFIFPLSNALKYQDALATAMIDPLTGLNNRGAMSITLNREIERARRHEDQDISVVMVDVDHFKDINDRYGHLNGDDVLRQVANVIQNSIRGCDACFRYGGEEFLVLLSNSNLAFARIVSERIRNAIKDDVRLPDKARPVTASLGVAHYNNEADWPELVHRADKALYSAKHQGRNCVVTSLDSTQSALGTAQ